MRTIEIQIKKEDFKKKLGIRDGIDGSPDTPDQVIEKVHASNKLIEPSKIRGLINVINEVARYGTNPQGQNVGGGNPLVLKSNGARISDYITDLNVTGAGGTLTYSNNGVATLNLTGGGGGFTELAATGTCDGINAVFTFTSVPSYIVSDGVWLKATGKSGTAFWTNVGLTITMTNPPIFDIFGVA